MNKSSQLLVLTRLFLSCWNDLHLAARWFMLISSGLANGSLDLPKMVRLGLIKSLKDTCLNCIVCFVCEMISTYLQST